MSLPNYLTKIKSAGIYRFVWDKSQVSPQVAETIRLLVGYSEKGPFNTPVYIDNIADFQAIFGKGTKQLERRGVYFHRLAEQALLAGPILALNLKPFQNETVGYISTNMVDIKDIEQETAVNNIGVKSIFNTNRFWALDADSMIKNIKTEEGSASAVSYMTIAATDTANNSCSVIMRKAKPASYSGIKVRDWYVSQGLEIPEYLTYVLDANIDDYFIDVYVFRGNLIGESMTGDEGVLAKYFTEEGNISTELTDSFGENIDALATLANDPNSNFIGAYSGCTIPYFKDANGNYISIDLKFNADNYLHKMLMKLDESLLDEVTAASEVNDLLKLDTTATDTDVYYNAKAKPIYIKGYTYDTIDKSSTMDEIYTSCMEVLKEKGIRTALTNRVDVEYHYLVDTFDSAFNNNKEPLLTIAKEKDNAFAILNFPKLSLYTPGEGRKTLAMEKDVFGDDKFKMPGETAGASYGAYYTQLVITDGTVKTTIPSAALVSNLFMEKWGPRNPFDIVAGPTYGRITTTGLVGPDYNFGRSDLDVLEPKGVNAIIYVPRKGTYINSNQTAKQIPVSGLSKIHIRELIIYLQNEIENLLQTYQWELNTQTLRDTVKTQADAICERIKANGGLYAYVNICDSSNNTTEVIDNEMLILDTEIEPARGAGKMVHRLTIHKTGGLTSTSM